MGKILIACEESQEVCKAFRLLGYEAFSCDILPCSGKHPEWHIQKDVTEVLFQKWDMVLAFPPCTDLCSSGARWFKEKQSDGRQQKSINFFMLFTKLKCYWAIENPIGIMSTKYRKPILTESIQSLIDQSLLSTIEDAGYKRSFCQITKSDVTFVIQTDAKCIITGFVDGMKQFISQTVKTFSSDANIRTRSIWDRQHHIQTMGVLVYRLLRLHRRWPKGKSFTPCSVPPIGTPIITRIPTRSV